MSDRESLTRRPLLLGSGSVLALVALGCAGKQPKIEQPVVTIDAALDRLRHNIERHVEDKQRRKRALAKLEELREVLADFDRLALEWRTETLEALERGEDSEGMSSVADRVATKFEAGLRRAATVAVELRSDIGASEWPLVFRAAEEPAS